MYLEEINGLKIGSFPTLDILAPELSVLFFSRKGGVSDPPFDSLNLGHGLGDPQEKVEKNREKVIKHLDLLSKNIAKMDQVHGTNIQIVDSGGPYAKTDGMISKTRGIALAVSTADCYPVFLYAPSEKILAALHVGKAGALKGIIGKAAGMMADEFQADISNTYAIAGPGICGKCYTVSDSDAKSFPCEVTRLRKDGWHLDLPRFITNELEEAGISKEHTLFSNICTSCYPELCFSYRRDKGVTGRHWTTAVISPRSLSL
ncbi:MAG: peptidoglycan editing factor PgeF [Candidatus Krumholzibacteriota bacterium]|nr:peptidoglycan editing factor PgeF [Candidatus Krumholzibacteriota bacterium]